VDLGKIAKSVRRRIFEFKTRTGKGHLASCLSLVDLLVSMYYDEETNFNHKEDIVIYSKGHGSPAVYPILADLGYIENDELEKYCQPEGKLRLHADQSIPGCHFVGGSLGNGIGYAAGLAYGTGKNVYAILGDAELYEGSVWETLIFVAHHKINNLYMFVSFGLEVHEVDGHDFDELRKVLSIKSDNPKMIIADTIKGKGVSYMEDVWQYHTIIPKEKDLLETAMEELN